jgi:hypothetical protein
MNKLIFILTGGVIVKCFSFVCRRVSNISSLYLEKTSFAVSETGRSSNAGAHAEQVGQLVYITVV